jgi:hypothetical protein
MDSCAFQETNLGISGSGSSVTRDDEQDSGMNPLEDWQLIIANHLDTMIQSNLEFGDISAPSTSVRTFSHASPRSADTSLFISHYPFSGRDTGIKLFRSDPPRTFSPTQNPSQKIGTKEESDSHQKKDSKFHEKEDDDEEAEKKLQLRLATAGVAVEFVDDLFKPVT